jgi:hypothetical protein
MNNKGQFKKGEHWRKPMSFWDKEWLFSEYVINNRSASDIAKEFNMTEGTILHWLRKYKITRRTVSEARLVKHWGSSGSKNPMFGKTGDKNPNWKGGICPERQKMYASLEWKNVRDLVIERDKNTCQRCGKILNRSHLIIHHISSFKNKSKRTDLNNLIALCRECHVFVHSKRNIDHEYIR